MLLAACQTQLVLPWIALATCRTLQQGLVEANTVCEQFDKENISFLAYA